MEMKSRGKIRKSKAYGAVGVITLMGALLFAVGDTTVKADESVAMATTPPPTIQASSSKTQTIITESSTSTNVDDSTVDISSETTTDMASTETSSSSVATKEISKNSDTVASDTATPDKSDAQGTATSSSSTSEAPVTDMTVSSTEQAPISATSNVSPSDSKATANAQADDSKTPTNIESAATGVNVNEVVSASLTADGISVQYNQAIATGAQLLFAVWSKKNGQDDIVWYQADSSGKALASYTGDYGIYYVHTYQSLNGQMSGLNATEIDVAEPRVTSTITKKTATTYQVVISNVPAYITNIMLPTWTSFNGQDDIKWYHTSQISPTSYTATVSIAEHNLESGVYNVHVYGESAVTKSLVGLEGSSFTSDYTFGDITVATTVGANGINISMPSDISSSLTVFHAVWSDINGQDDIKWYPSKKDGNTVASYTGTFGVYYVHTYALINGQMVALNGTSITVEKPNVTATITKVSNVSYQVTVSDVPSYITSVVMPTWTSFNDQDDIVWTQASKNSNGTYTANILAKDHNFQSGHYNVHIYATSAVTNSLIGLMATNGIDMTVTVSETNPEVTVQNYNAGNGTLEVVFSQTDTSKDIRSVSLAAWSQDGQKNIYWYTTSTVTKGEVIITVDEKYHHSISGNYTIHAYLTTTDGNSTGYVVGNYVLSSNKSTSSVNTTYKGTGIYSVDISGVYSNGGVVYAVWSDTNGQDDIKWYNASTSGTRSSGWINVADHSGTGTYNVHVYQNDNGNMYFLTSTTFIVDQTNFSTPYYNQRDGRWGNTYYGYYSLGATGCVPTSLAMVFSSLTGATVLPGTVANYLYNNTIEFDRGFAGTSGQGILMASHQWGMSTAVLGSQSSLTTALQEGHHVLAAVQNDKFVLSGTHELVLKGYSNGMTYVYDPYTTSNCGWYPVSSLWSEQSTDRIDISSLGSPFVKITDV